MSKQSDAGIGTRLLGREPNPVAKLSFTLGVLSVVSVTTGLIVEELVTIGVVLMGLMVILLVIGTDNTVVAYFEGGEDAE